MKMSDNPADFINNKNFKPNFNLGSNLLEANAYETAKENTDFRHSL